MNMPSRRNFLGFAGAAAGAAALAACTSSPPPAPGEGNSSAANANKSGAMTNYGVGTQFKATKPLTFSIAILSNPNYPYKANWLFFTHLKQLTNVSFNPTVIPFADYNTKVGTLIAAGQQPYIIPKTYPVQESAFVAGGQILPVSDYVQHMPNYQAKVAAWNLQGDLDTLRQSDGKYYLLPGLHQSVPLDYTMGVRTDLLTKYNIPTPSTLAQVEAMLTTFKDRNPGHFPFSDRYNQPTAGGAFLQMIGNAYGTNAGWSYQSYNQGAYFDQSTKQYVFAAAMPQQAPAEKPTLQLAALAPTTKSASFGDGFDVPAAEGAVAPGLPTKGGRPTQKEAAAADASRATVRTEPKLNQKIISQWALTQGRVETMNKPVKPPRFVSRSMREAPTTVYEVGFQPETAGVDPARFSGNAVNFMEVRKFSDTN